MSDPALYGQFSVWLADYTEIGNTRYVETKTPPFVAPTGNLPEEQGYRHGLAVAMFCQTAPRDPVQYGVTLESLPAAFVERRGTGRGPIRRLYIQAHPVDEPPV